MANYIDGFVLPVPRTSLNEYKSVAEKVAEIWKEYGALAYFENVGEDLKLEGTRSFIEVVDLKEDEVIVFGWVVFPSKNSCVPHCLAEAAQQCVIPSPYA